MLFLVKTEWVNTHKVLARVLDAQEPSEQLITDLSFVLLVYTDSEPQLFKLEEHSWIS